MTYKKTSTALKEFFDPEERQVVTGLDIYEAVIRESVNESRQRWDKTFPALFVALQQIVMSPKLKVICYLLSRMHFGTNEFTCSRTEASEATGVSKATVNRVFDEAFKADLIRCVRGSRCMVNPNCTYSGSSGLYKKLVRDYGSLVDRSRKPEEEHEPTALEEKLNSSKAITDGGDEE